MEDNEDICKVPFLETVINANFNICEEILDAYYKQVPQPTDRSQVSSAYIGKLYRYNSPYRVNIYGAYPPMVQWKLLESKMENCNEEYFKAYQRKEVYEHLKNFAKGFQDGYNDFIKDKIDDGDLLTSTEASQPRAIMDFLSSSLNRFGFSETHDSSKHIFHNWYNDGKTAGYEYRAWITIFKNHESFKPFFTTTTKAVIKRKDLPSSQSPKEVYHDVLETISTFGKELEKKTSGYQGKKEEELRDLFIANLAGRYERATATGETFNKDGKTDILIKDDNGDNLFIAECKWWAGGRALPTTINQLFNNYITWRDIRLAIIFFVKNKNFSSVLAQVKDKIKKHEYCLKYTNVTEETNFHFEFRQKDDTQRKVNIAFMFFHFP